MSNNLLKIDWGYVESHPITHSEDGIVLETGTVINLDENTYRGFVVRNEDPDMWYSLETFNVIRPLTEEEKEFIYSEEFLPF